LGATREGLPAYEEIVDEMKIRMERDAAQYTDKDIEDLVVVDQATGLKIYPHWVAQPYFRVGPQKEALVEQS